MAGSTHELSGSTPRTRIWSIRTTGNLAGQLKPKPSPAVVLGRAQLRGEAGERAVVRGAVQVAEQHHPLVLLGGDGLAERLRVPVPRVRPEARPWD